MTDRTTTTTLAWFVRRVRLPAEASTGRYPCTLPAVARRARREKGLEMPAGVTDLAGENGTGKSTLIEALASIFHAAS